jgi:ribosomal protein S18 acetylase RimI-like enzyme
MPEITIRALESEDIKYLRSIEHGYYTDYVWQMSLDMQSEKIQTTFQRVRLPRQIFVSYPRKREIIIEDFEQSEAILTAELNNSLVGYINLRSDHHSGVASVSDLIVSSSMRRQGIASGLMMAAMDLCTNRHFHTLILEVQSKNDPAIRMANKLGFNFCGFQDHYFPNQEMALFFSRFTR